MLCKCSIPDGGHENHEHRLRDQHVVSDVVVAHPAAFHRALPQLCSTMCTGLGCASDPCLALTFPFKDTPLDFWLLDLARQLYGELNIAQMHPGPVDSWVGAPITDGASNQSNLWSRRRELLWNVIEWEKGGWRRTNFLGQEPGEASRSNLALHFGWALCLWPFYSSIFRSKLEGKIHRLRNHMLSWSLTNRTGYINLQARGNVLIPDLRWLSNHSHLHGALECFCGKLEGLQLSGLNFSLSVDEREPWMYFLFHLPG